MPTILSIETATQVCSVAIHSEGKLKEKRDLNEERSHSSKLAPMIKEIMENTGVALEELDAVAVSGGPGSYTGLRIGTSTAKGLCFSLDIPLIAVDTLHAMAHSVIRSGQESDIFCPMIDARRMEVYGLLMDGKGEVILPTQPMVIDQDSFSDELKSHSICFFGNGMEKCREILSGHENSLFEEGVVPSAENVGVIANEKYSRGEFEDLAYFEPFYLKPFRATKPKLS